MKFFPLEVWFVNAAGEVALDSRWEDRKLADKKVAQLKGGFGAEAFVLERTKPEVKTVKAGAPK